MTSIHQHNTPIVPTSNDILCGKGLICSQHEGNKQFHAIINSKVVQYINGQKRDKTFIVKQIIKEITVKNNGRFLRKSLIDPNEWYDAGKRAAREKIGHAFRNAVALYLDENKDDNNNKSADPIESSKVVKQTDSVATKAIIRQKRKRRQASKAQQGSQALTVMKNTTTATTTKMGDTPLLCTSSMAPTSMNEDLSAISFDMPMNTLESLERVFSIKKPTVSDNHSDSRSLQPFNLSLTHGPVDEPVSCVDVITQARRVSISLEDSDCSSLTHMDIHKNSEQPAIDFDNELNSDDFLMSLDDDTIFSDLLSMVSNLDWDELQNTDDIFLL